MVFLGRGGRASVIGMIGFLGIFFSQNLWNADAILIQMVNSDIVEDTYLIIFSYPSSLHFPRKSSISSPKPGKLIPSDDPNFCLIHYHPIIQ